MHFQQNTLPNGLTVLTEINPSVQSVAFGFFVKTGSRDETPGVSGVSHFLEHMVFKGSEKYSAETVNRFFDEIGAQYNAMTGEESTLYYATVLPEHFAAGFELFSSILFPSLRDDDFSTEKQVILEEIGMYDDQPSFVAYDHVMRQYFNRHPLGKPILGTRETVGALTAEQMRSYHCDNYLAGNITLVVAGKTSPAEVLELVNRHCEHWPAGTVVRDYPPFAPEKASIWLARENSQLEHVMQLAPAPDSKSRLRYAAELLAVLASDDGNSRLYWELIDPGHAESCDVSYNELDGLGTYMTYLGCEPDETRANLERITHVYEQLRREGVTSAEFEQARNKVATRIVIRGERPMGRLSSLGGNWLYRQEYRSITDDLAVLRALTIDDLNDLMEQFPLSQTVTVGVGPLGSLE